MGEGGKIIWLLLQFHHQYDSCINMGSVESHFNISLNVRNKVTRHCPQTTTFEEKGEPKRIWTEASLLISLNPYHQAKLDHCTNLLLWGLMSWDVQHVSVVQLMQVRSGMWHVSVVTWCKLDPACGMYQLSSWCKLDPACGMYQLSSWCKLDPACGMYQLSSWCKLDLTCNHCPADVS